MAVNGAKPSIQVIDSNGAPIVGATLKVYEATTTTYRAIYSDAGLSTPLTNPIAGVNASDATGTFPVFYMAAGLYKLRAETAATTLIWEYDNLDTGTSAGSGALPITNGGTGATTASAARANLDVPSTEELTAVSSQISNFTAALANISAFPQGRLTQTSGAPIISTSVSASTALYYTPYTGNLCPVFDGVQFNLQLFTEQTLTLVSNHTASNIFDVFFTMQSGSPVIVTGPAWQTSTAGAGARGSGGGTTELTRHPLNGLLVNANAMATARNGATTYVVGQYQGTYLGSIFMDGTNGQLSCLISYGQSRKFGVWNYYNRAPIFLKAGDATASWSYATNTVRPSNNAAANSLTIFSGLAEENYDLQMEQMIIQSQSGTSTDYATIGIGFNSTTAASGFSPQFGFTAISGAGVVINNYNRARFLAVPSIGIQTITALENGMGSTGTAPAFKGSETNMVLSAQWRG